MDNEKITNENQKEVNEKYVELQVASNQLKQIEQQVEVLDNQIIEVLSIIQSIEEFKNIASNSKSLAPIANGIFVESKIENTENLLVNVGSGIVVKKSIDETKQMLEFQLDELRSAQNEFVNQFQQLSLKAQNLQLELRKLI